MTSPAEIERVAFRLFAEHGFEGATLQAIAEEVGVGRRTQFRNYESKNDISWGQFGQTLQRFRKILGATGTGRRTPREPWRAGLARCGGQYHFGTVPGPTRLLIVVGRHGN